MMDNKLITTQCGTKAVTLKNVLGLVNNQLCVTEDNTFVLVHNDSKHLNLIFEPDVSDSVIQSVCLSIDKLTHQLPHTVTVSNTIAKYVV